MLAILDSRLVKDTQQADGNDKGVSNKDDFKPAELICSLLHLPADFLCDTGYIYETVFRRPPSSVIKEALQLLVQKTFEKSPAQLGIDQINLAIKQLRLENLGDISGSEVQDEDQQQQESGVEGGEGEAATSSAGTAAVPVPVPVPVIVGTAEEETFRLQIMVELIRMHISSMNENRSKLQVLASAGAGAGEESSCVDGETVLEGGAAAAASGAGEGGVRGSSSCTGTGAGSTSSQTGAPTASDANRARFGAASSGIGGSSTRYAADSKAPPAAAQAMEQQQQPPLPKKLDMLTIERHLRTPLKVVFEQAGSMSSEDLEVANMLLKPYLKQLAGLKSSLQAELKDLLDSRAFLALGLSPEASDEAIKKAYRMLAIRLHPDKPGGDTARFQQLQDSYQEVMRKRKADRAEKDAMEEVKSRHTRAAAGAGAGGGRGGAGAGAAEGEDAGEGEDEVKQRGSAFEGVQEGDDKKKKKKKKTTKGEVVKKGNPDKVTAEEGKEGEEKKPVEDEENKEGEGEDEEGEEEEGVIEFDEDGLPIVKEKKLKTKKSVPDAASDVGEEDEEDEEASESSEREDGANDDDDGEGEGEGQGSDREVDLDDLLNDMDTEGADMEAIFRRLAGGAPGAGAGAGAGLGGKRKGKSKNGGDGAEKPVTYESEAAHAQAILGQITELLQRIKKASSVCTELAQLNIKWQKMLDKAMSADTVSLKDVYKIMTASTGPKSVMKGTGTSNNSSCRNLLEARAAAASAPGAAGGDDSQASLPNIDACALQQAITPVELICDWAQKVAGLAMELPNLCGIRYAAAASGNRSFLMAVEKSMQLSLGALKTVLGLINAQEQLGACVRRVRDSLKLAAENPEIQDLLLEMLQTGVKSNVITISSTGTKHCSFCVCVCYFLANSCTYCKLYRHRHCYCIY
jgi:curved DNA-binding protein CbpA